MATSTGSSAHSIDFFEPAAEMDVQRVEPQVYPNRTPPMDKRATLRCRGLDAAEADGLESSRR